MNHKALDLEVSINSLAFHPLNDLLSLCTVEGSIVTYKLDQNHGLEITKVWNQSGSASTRDIKYSPKGNGIATVSADGKVTTWDVELGKAIWSQECANSLYTLAYLSESLIATGDEQGELKIWDLREGKSVAYLKEFDDYIAELFVLPGTNFELLATSAEKLGVFDLRKNLKLKAMSDDVEDEMVTIDLVKDGKKVVCGTLGGWLYQFSYGYWGDITDRVKMGKAVNSVAKFNESTLCTADDGGEIYVVKIHPNSIAGKVVSHLEDGRKGLNFIDSLEFNYSKSILAFVGDFSKVYFVDGKEIDVICGDGQDDGFFDELAN